MEMMVVGMDDIRFMVDSSRQAIILPAGLAGV